MKQKVQVQERIKLQNIYLKVSSYIYLKQKKKKAQGKKQFFENLFQLKLFQLITFCLFLDFCMLSLLYNVRKNVY